MNARPETPAAGAVQQTTPRYPPGIPYIVGNEGAERFSYYGMRAILYVYLTALYVTFRNEALVPEADLKAAKAQATAVTHLFFAGVYLFPMIGAILSDRLLGKYNVIFWLSLVYCAGHGVLAVAGRLGESGNFAGAEMGMYLGLTLIAIGSGGIKPCVSANVGDQFTRDNSSLVSRVFQIFYFIINFGSFFSTLLTPLLYKHVGPEVAFGVPGVLMGVATVIFWMGRNRFTRVPPKPGGSLGLLDTLATLLMLSPIFALIYGYFVLWDKFDWSKHGEVEGWAAIGLFFSVHWWLLIVTTVAVVAGFMLFQARQRRQPDNGFLAVLLYAIRSRHQRQPGEGFFAPARAKYGEEAGDGPAAVLKIVVVFSMISAFWALFDQHASTWVQQAREMNLVLSVPKTLWTCLLAGTVGLALYGGTWLFLHVSNVSIPRRVSLGVGGAFVAALALGGVIDWASQNPWKDVPLQASQVQALNPLIVMLVIPLLNFGVWGPLQKRGVTVTPLRKMTIGMFLTAAAFVIAALLQARIETVGEGKVPVLMQVPQYLVMTTAEVLVSTTGLEFAYTQAPRAMKSTIMGFWLLAVTFGNLIVAFLAPLQKTIKGSEFFWVFAAIMAAAAVIFAVLAKFYRGKTYLQK